MLFLVSHEALKRAGGGGWRGGGGLLACTPSNRGLLTLSPQSVLDGQRWYFIILVHSVYSDSIITLYISFSGASFPLSFSLSSFSFKLHI